MTLPPPDLSLRQASCNPLPSNLSLRHLDPLPPRPPVRAPTGLTAPIPHSREQPDGLTPAITHPTPTARTLPPFSPPSHPPAQRIVHQPPPPPHPRTPPTGATQPTPKLPQTTVRTQYTPPPFAALPAPNHTAPPPPHNNCIPQHVPSHPSGPSVSKSPPLSHNTPNTERAHEVTTREEHPLLPLSPPRHMLHPPSPPLACYSWPPRPTPLRLSPQR